MQRMQSMEHLVDVAIVLLPECSMLGIGCVVDPTAPSRYSLQLRLEKARALLQRTNKPAVQIGLSCGFSSGPHFSTVYRAHFGNAPREERLKELIKGTTLARDEIRSVPVYM